MNFRKFYPLFFVLCSLFFSTFSFAAPEVQTYTDLLKALRDVRAGTAERIALAASQERVREAWEMGTLINEHILLNKDRADYGDYVLKKLGDDLEISSSDLYSRLRFARLYPAVPETKLSWSHFRILGGVVDDAERKKIEVEAETNQWSSIKLQEEVLRRKLTLTATREKPLTPERGLLNTYQIISENDKLKIDLGFSNYKDLPHEFKTLKQGDIIQVEKWNIVPAPGKTALDLYTYEAEIIEVTDGDTLWVMVNLGFGLSTKQQLRLRGLDTPELPSAEGQGAKAFVQERLKTGQKIIICSTRSDKYDRYLADIYYKDKDGAEKFLNNELLENNLAIRA